LKKGKLFARGRGVGYGGINVIANPCCKGES